MLAVFRQPQLVTLWLAQIFSSIGDQIYQIAIVMIAVKATGSEAGFILAAQGISRLVCGLVSGAYADRLKRQQIMIAADLLRAVVLLTLPLATLWGDITLVHLTIVSVIIGGIGAFFQPALIASLPELSPSSQNLQALNSLMDATFRVARIIGPAIAGWLLVIVPISYFFSLDALTFCVSAFAIYRISHHFGNNNQPEERKPIRIWKDLRDSWILLRGRPHILSSIIVNSLTNGIWGCVFMIGGALISEARFTNNESAFASMLMFYGIGNIISNILIGNWVTKYRTRVVFLGTIPLTAGFIVLALAPSFPYALLGASIAALGGPMMNLTIVLMIQQEFPQDVIGKVYSFQMVAGSTGYSLGISLAVPLFALMSLSSAIVTLSIAMLLMGLWGMWEFWMTHSDEPTDSDRTRDSDGRTDSERTALA